MTYRDPNDEEETSGSRYEDDVAAMFELDERDDTKDD